jgi:protein-tyrosine phosphatase
MFELNACHVERLSDREYRVRWGAFDPPQAVAVFILEDLTDFYSSNNPGVPVVSTSENEVVIANPNPSLRHYFYLQSEMGESTVLAERRLSLQGAPNFRDLGGYTTADGRRLKWGKLFRSGKLSSLTDEDRRYVQQLGLTLVCDFRQLVEQSLHPTSLAAASSHRVASLPVKPGSHSNFMENLHQGIVAVDDAAELMRHINRDFVVNQMPQYAEMFQQLLTEDKPMLIHCASGKDRAGFGAALLLDVLGVEEDLIVHDYMLTNQYLPIEEEIYRLSRELTDHDGSPVSEQVLRPLLEVRPDYIRACFDEIKKRHESKQHFYENALNLDEKKLAILTNRYLH